MTQIIYVNVKMASLFNMWFWQLQKNTNHYDIETAVEDNPNIEIFLRYQERKSF